MKVALYARVSSDKQDIDLSISAQLRALREYAGRSGDQEIVVDLEERIMGILNYFEPFENEEGLLEGLEGWVFVEWSRVNDWVQDVNYPSNMHYAAALETVARLYGRPELAEKAEKIRHFNINLRKI